MESHTDCAFPPVSLIGPVLKKVSIDQGNLILITPIWQVQSWCSQLLQIAVKNPVFLPKMPSLLIGPNSENHMLVEKGCLHLLVWTVSWKSCLHKDYQKNLSLSSQMPKERAHALITNHLGVSGLSGA